MSRPKGLTYIASYLSDIEQNTLLQEIDALPWSNELKRRVQHYGYKYDYTKKNINREMAVGPLPPACQHLAQKLVEDNIFIEKPDQLIINEYLPGQGIAPHIDCVPCFEDIIVSISLGDVYVMDFTKFDDKLSLSLAVGSLLCLSGEARYKWRHGIVARVKDGDHERKRRISLTFRRVILT